MIGGDSTKISIADTPRGCAAINYDRGNAAASACVRIRAGSCLRVEVKRRALVAVRFALRENASRKNTKPNEKKDRRPVMRL